MTTTLAPATIQNQTFGVEIELTGITRENAAKVAAELFGTTHHYIGSYYDVYGADDSEGRTWKFMSDGSICCVDEDGDPACSSYSCELVTPILRYEDLETLTKLMDKLVENHAVANSSTGIHVHVSAEQHTLDSLKALLNLAVSREGLLYEALEIGSRADHWCHRTTKRLAEAASKAETLDEFEDIWYSRDNDLYCSCDSRRDHYNETRYHGVNLHSLFQGKGIEFRYFNGTTDANKIVAYVQLCLGLNACAINGTNAGSFTEGEYSNEKKIRHMKRFLRRCLGLNATEYKNVNNQLTAVWAQ